jgi:diguanylate cyclase (GGDEF)-like protein
VHLPFGGGPDDPPDVSEGAVGLRSAEAGSRARLAGLLVLVALLPLLALAWLAAAGVGRSETRKADLRLESEARSVFAVFVRSVGQADSRAGSLASSPALQEALAARDRDRLRQLVGANDVVSAGGPVLVGTPEAHAVRRSVSVAVRGRPVGSVTVNIPLDQPLLARLRSEVRLDPRDRLALVQGGRAIVGAVAGPVAVTLGQSMDRRLSGARYRIFAVELVGPPDSVQLLALTPRSQISGGVRNRLLWTLLAILVTLATIGAAGYAVAPFLGARGGPFSLIAGRRDARALALVGDALASTHNPDKLLPVILHATMEATGAVGGRVLQDGRVTAEEGDVVGTGRPLRLELGAEEGTEEIALQLWPAAGGFDERTRALAQSLAAQAAIALENARLHGIVQRQAITDELTELANRRYFMETLETELRRAERFDEPLALVFADLDDFKRVNDRFGHHVGDQVLRAFADVVRKRLRSIDLAARLGGEEFAVLLLETDLKGAEALAESLRSAVAALEVRIVGGPAVGVTASFGVAAYPQTHDADELMTAADLALYRAKRAGKNRVSVGKKRPPPPR